MAMRGIGVALARPRTLAALVALALAASACGSSGEDDADAAGGGSGDAAETAEDAPSGEATGSAPEGGSGEEPAEEPAEEGPVFPDPEWEVLAPEDSGVDTAPLSELAAYLQEGNSSCMVVVHEGRIVAEEYWNGWDEESAQEVFSVTKSVTSALVGIAQEEGFLDISQPASTWITEWQGTPSEAVTVRNLLSNDSGRHWDFVGDYTTMAVQAEDKTAYGIGLDQQQPPGEHWEYNNSAIQTLEAVLERSTGSDVEEFAQEHLFGPIGMEATMGRDAAGNPLTFMGVKAGCRAMARFGWLYDQDGRWGDEQVVPADWVEASTSSSQELNRNYGFLWWLNTDGGFFEGAPTDAYAALGLGNQIVLVVPSEDLVVVRIGGAPPGTTMISSQGSMVTEMARLSLEAIGAS
jgi:CubicO group peptidase (beta-lactamase class C family)